MHFVFLDSGDSAWSLSGGFLGVDVFLVLSGFLIGSVLLSEASRSGTVDGSRFFRRRLQRLLPPLLALMGVQAVVGVIINSNLREQLLQVALTLSVTANWQASFGHQAPFELVHLWSLSLEAQFYALSALFVWSVRKRLDRPKTLVVWLLIGAVVVAIWRLCLFHAGVSTEALYQRTDTRLDSLLLGMAAALIRRSSIFSDRTIRIFGICGGLILAVSALKATHTSGWLFSGGFTLISAATAAVVSAIATGEGVIHWIGDRRTLRWIGIISYSLYLWHLPIYIWTVRAVPNADLWQKVLIAVPLSFLAAYTAFRVVESRALAPWRGGRMKATVSHRPPR